MTETCRRQSRGPRTPRSRTPPYYAISAKSLVCLPCPAPGLPGSPLAAVLQCVKCKVAREHTVPRVNTVPTAHSAQSEHREKRLGTKAFEQPAHYAAYSIIISDKCEGDRPTARPVCPISPPRASLEESELVVV